MHVACCAPSSPVALSSDCFLGSCALKPNRNFAQGSIISTLCTFHLEVALLRENKSIALSCIHTMKLAIRGQLNCTCCQASIWASAFLPQQLSLMTIDVYSSLLLGDMCLKKAASIAAQGFSQILFAFDSHDEQWGLQDQKHSSKFRAFPSAVHFTVNHLKILVFLTEEWMTRVLVVGNGKTIHSLHLWLSPHTICWPVSFSVDLAAVPKCYTAKQVFQQHLLGSVFWGSGKNPKIGLGSLHSESVISLGFICLEFPISLLFQVWVSRENIYSQDYSLIPLAWIRFKHRLNSVL